MLGRCFTLAKVPFIGITSQNDARIIYSKYCLYGYKMPNPYENIDDAFIFLQKLVEEVGEGHPLYCSNDGHLKMMLKYWSEMKRMFSFVSVDKETLETILNKEKFVQYAVRYKLPVPITYTNEALFTFNDINFPVIVKPTIRINWYNSLAVRKYGGKNYKGILVRDKSQLKSVCQMLEKDNNKYIVQQYIPGPESNIISFHSFFSEDSRPLCYFVGRKIRTYPIVYGESCALRLTDYDTITETSLQLLKRISFRGPIKIDYKIDERTGKLYLLELNPTRYNMWHYLGARGGVNIPYIAYQYMIHGQVDIIYNQWRKDIVWFNFFNDFQAYLDLKKQGYLSFWKWLKSYRGRRIYKTLALDDLPPVFYGMKMTLKGAWRRLKKMVFR